MNAATTPFLARFAARYEAWCDRIGVKLRALPAGGFAALATVATLAVSVFCFSPKFVFWQLADPATVEWARAYGVHEQAKAPLQARPEVETALRWRLLPALVIQTLGGGMAAVVLLPWAGLLLWLYASAQWLDSRLVDRVVTLHGLLLLGTSGTVITLTNYFGMNDAWFLLALGAVCFSPAGLPLLAAGLAGPWVDERFILALPLAWLCRHLTGGRTDRRMLGAVTTGPLLYLFLRLAALLDARDPSSITHLETHLHYLLDYLPYGPLGWLMGFRFGWLLLAFATLTAWRTRPRLAAGLLLAGGAGMAAVTLVAADLTRSTNLLVPFFLCALPFLAGAGAARLRPFLGLLLAGNLLTPFIWVTYTHCHRIWPLPVELWRWLR